MEQEQWLQQKMLLFAWGYNLEIVMNETWWEGGGGGRESTGVEFLQVGERMSKFSAGLPHPPAVGKILV